jgi:UPF0176 protein
MAEQKASCDSNSLTVSENSPEYLVLAYYHLVQLDNPQLEVEDHKEFLSARDVRARVYISTQGINGQMSAAPDDAYAYMQWLSQKAAFKDVEFKIQNYPEHCFPRLTIKVRKELVALGESVSLENRADYLTPSEWKKTIESDEDKVVLDVRNDYEWKLGHFEGAELFPCETFKDFKESVVELKKRIDSEKTKVLMYCTGGIRCEIFSALLKKEGIDNVFQLHGGIIRYGEEEGAKNWLGKLFVFDDRLAVPLSENSEAVAIGKCHHCAKANESYYNCANMDCNELFLCCVECLEKFKGCCMEECLHAKRVRPYQFSHKPFRKWYNYAKSKEELNTLTKTSCDRR